MIVVGLVSRYDSSIGSFGHCDDTEPNTFPIERSAVQRLIVWHARGSIRNTHPLHCVYAPALRGLVVECLCRHERRLSKIKMVDTAYVMLGAPVRRLVFLAGSLALIILGVFTMTTKPHARPGFASRNTDGDLNTSLAQKEKVLDAKERGLDSNVSKAGVEVDIQDGELHHGPAFAEQGEDDFPEKNVPVETAADLVTQIIHLEDDPDERSLTFRTWFLGKRNLSLHRLHVLICACQVSDSQSSHRCFRRYFTSSLKQFSCHWCS